MFKKNNLSKHSFVTRDKSQRTSLFCHFVLVRLCTISIEVLQKVPTSVKFNDVGDVTDDVVFCKEHNHCKYFLLLYQMVCCNSSSVY